MVGVFQLGTWVNDMSEVGGGTRTEIDVKRDPSSLSQCRSYQQKLRLGSEFDTADTRIAQKLGE